VFVAGGSRDVERRSKKTTTEGGFLAFKKRKKNTTKNAKVTYPNKERMASGEKGGPQLGSKKKKEKTVDRKWEGRSYPTLGGHQPRKDPPLRDVFCQGREKRRHRNQEVLPRSLRKREAPSYNHKGEENNSSLLAGGEGLSRESSAAR